MVGGQVLQVLVDLLYQHGMGRSVEGTTDPIHAQVHVPFPVLTQNVQ